MLPSSSDYHSAFTASVLPESISKILKPLPEKTPEFENFGHAVKFVEEICPEIKLSRKRKNENNINKSSFSKNKKLEIEVNTRDMSGMVKLMEEKRKADGLGVNDFYGVSSKSMPTQPQQEFINNPDNRYSALIGKQVHIFRKDSKKRIYGLLRGTLTCYAKYDCYFLINCEEIITKLPDGHHGYKKEDFQGPLRNIKVLPKVESLSTLPSLTMHTRFQNELWIKSPFLTELTLP